MQVHYYEDGNVQLVCSKEISQSVNVTVSAALLYCRLSSLLLPSWLWDAGCVYFCGKLEIDVDDIFRPVGYGRIHCE